MRYYDDIVGVNQQEDKRRVLRDDVIFDGSRVPILPSAVNTLIRKKLYTSECNQFFVEAIGPESASFRVSVNCFL